MRREVWLIEEVLLNERTDLVAPRMSERLHIERLRHEERVTDRVVPIELFGERLVELREPRKELLSDLVRVLGDCVVLPAALFGDVPAGLGGDVKAALGGDAAVTC